MVRFDTAALAQQQQQHAADHGAAAVDDEAGGISAYLSAYGTGVEEMSS